MQNGKPSLLLPDRPLPCLAPVLVDVIFETIERIREQDRPPHGTACPRRARDRRLPVRAGVWQAQHAGRCTKLLDESFVTAANLEGHW
jgi:branched-chain amino acid transport system ATP-binding protein